MKILIVGAGAVGKVYGRHLALGGADVSFLIKEKYFSQVQQGITFYELNATRKKPIEMTQFSFLTSYAEVKKERWDYIILSTDSTALREPWLEELMQSLGKATLVSLQPGINDYDFLAMRMSQARISYRRLIVGTIPIVSYTGPLPGEHLEKPGTVYWLPPLAQVVFKGESGLILPLQVVFNYGRLPTIQTPFEKPVNLVAGPALTLFVLALESCQWSFQNIKRSSQLKQACLAMQEAVRVNAVHAKIKKPATWFLQPFLFRLLLKASRWIVPFDFETYLKIHFTKVNKQVHQNLSDFISFGREHQLPIENLVHFQKTLG